MQKNTRTLLLVAGVAAGVGVFLWANRAKAITSGVVTMQPGKRYRLTLVHSKEAGLLYRATLLQSNTVNPQMQLALQSPSETETIAEAVTGQPDPVVIGAQVFPGVYLKSVEEL